MLKTFSRLGISVLAGVVAGFLSYLVTAMGFRESGRADYETSLGMDRGQNGYTIKSPLTELGVSEGGADSDGDGVIDLWRVEASSDRGYPFEYMLHAPENGGDNWVASVRFGPEALSHSMAFRDDNGDEQPDQLGIVLFSSNRQDTRCSYYDLDLDSVIDWFVYVSAEGPARSFVLIDFTTYPAKKVDVGARIFDVQISPEKTQRMQLIDGIWKEFDSNDSGEQ